MAATQVNRGDPTAVTVNSVAFFAESLRTGTFRRNLKGAAPKRGAALAKIAQTENMATGMQTSPDFPIVQINDLSKGAGDTVTVDLVHIIEGKPTMGDRNVEGRLSALTFDDTDIIINQYRHGVDAGGRMSQQRTRWNLGKTAVAALGAWFGRLEDELCQVHLCGGRGSDDNRDWHVPLASDGEYSDIMVNPVTPPTYNRRFIAGGGAKTSDVGSSDSLRLADIDALRSWLDEMVFPPQPVRLPDDPMSDSEDPFYVLYLTSRQWSYLLLEADLTHNMRQFQADALRRAALTKHPLFKGEVGMWRGILCKKMRRAVRWDQSDVVTEYATQAATNSGTTSEHTIAISAGAAIDRGFLLGGQALAEAYGKNSESGYYSDWYEGRRDAGNRRIYVGSMMGGKKKLRFKLSDGSVTDHGVIAVDSYAPAPNSTAGRTLAGTLQS